MSRARKNYYLCRSKVRYRSRESAVVVLAKLQRGGFGVRPFPCVSCGQWHLGTWTELKHLRSLELMLELKAGQSDWWPVEEAYRNAAGDGGRLSRLFTNRPGCDKLNECQPTANVTICSKIGS